MARTSLPAPLHHRSERLERLVSATVLPPSTLCSTIRYTVCVHYKPITENSNCTLLLRYCTVCTRYSYPWVRGALSTESRISVKRRSIQDFPGLGPLCTRYTPEGARDRARAAGSEADAKGAAGAADRLGSRRRRDGGLLWRRRASGREAQANRRACCSRCRCKCRCP